LGGLFGVIEAPGPAPAAAKTPQGRSFRNNGIGNICAAVNYIARERLCVREISDRGKIDYRREISSGTGKFKQRRARGSHKAKRKTFRAEQTDEHRFSPERVKRPVQDRVSA